MRTHLNDFHEMCADEKACEWSSLRHTESPMACDLRHHVLDVSDTRQRRGLLYQDDWLWYATRALQLFLDEYWSQKRTAPKSDVYVSQIPAVNAVAFDKSLTGKIVDDRAQIPKMWESVKVWRFEEKRDMAVWRLGKPLKTTTFALHCIRREREQQT
ncbi:hypothetical protein CGMCC3_g15729 [Colletotrichum fructicola]|nr:uncharacterized protein CGMCC3_g15729 [Colletotrichum fructicola]KAE9568196.1 hypothetical protein CGMCC3_g15729 [Colletotrichum fructicola]